MQHYLDFIAAWLKQSEVALILGVLCILYALYFIVRCKYRPLFLYKNDGGVVTVTKSALIHMAEAICQELGLSQTCIKVRQKNKKLHWDIYFSMRTEDNLPELVSTLQSRLYRNLETVFGLEKQGSINIIVKGFNTPNTSTSSM